MDLRVLVYEVIKPVHLWVDAGYVVDCDFLVIPINFKKLVEKAD